MPVEDRPWFVELNSHSKAVARLLFEEYPEWLDYAGAHSIEHTLYVEIPSPDADEHWRLSIYTGNLYQDIIVRFGCNHTHFGWTPEEAFSLAKEWLDQFFDEKIVLGVKLGDDGYYTFARFYDLGEVDNIPPGELTYIRSWRGARNRRLE